MRRHLIFAVLFACSAKGPSGAPPAEAPRTMAQPGADPASAAAPATPPDPREAALARTVTRLLEQDHLLHKRLDDTVSRTAFDAYLERLDADKMFLLKSDRNALARYADQIDDELHSGSLDLAHEGEKTFVARIEVVDKLIQELLAQPMNHDDEEWLETDSKKTQPAVSEDELRDRWRKR